MRIGGVEAGGTKFVLGVADLDGQILSRTQLPTTMPEATLALSREWLTDQAGPTGLAAIGIGTFGPADINPASSTYGDITTTPKPGWQGAHVRAAFLDLAPVVTFDTDVAMAGLGEAQSGAGRDVDSLIYATIGTGIGAAFVKNGVPQSGYTHAEMGHFPVAQDKAADPYTGYCPYHGNCLEGLAAGPSIIDRWGVPLSELPEDHPGHQIIADYIAQFCRTVMLGFAPERIVLGGGVMKTPGLIERVVETTERHIAGYAVPPGASWREYIVTPQCGDDAGLVGALAHARGQLPR
ncbi:ROK family protein [Parvularcula sp. LCG005]|uniref:ROK family protein n=1 Tax=Parvularcula sp. LCG005 TaxID=3078805 RepID=UPI0029421DBE|nr:ROK family protein [Parvularcula sp. LCG005]WOI53329.1 ROK family protein [Parvularcula sp. LCG005]